jgi:hypothetical protein
MTEEAVTQSGGKLMKTFLLLAMSSVVTAGVLPSLPAKIILSAFVLLAALTGAAYRAPAGYQDEDGFHLVRVRRAVAKGRSPLRYRRARKKLLSGWLFSDSRRPAKA